MHPVQVEEGLQPVRGLIQVAQGGIVTGCGVVVVVGSTLGDQLGDDLKLQLDSAGDDGNASQ